MIPSVYSSHRTTSLFVLNMATSSNDNLTDKNAVAAAPRSFEDEQYEHFVNVLNNVLGTVAGKMDMKTASRADHLTEMAADMDPRRKRSSGRHRNERLLKRLNVAEVFRPFGPYIMEFMGKMMDTESILIGHYADVYFEPDHCSCGCVNGTGDTPTWEFCIGGGMSDFEEFGRFLAERMVVMSGAKEETISWYGAEVSTRVIEGSFSGGPVRVTLVPRVAATSQATQWSMPDAPGRRFIAGWGASSIFWDGDCEIYLLTDFIDEAREYDISDTDYNYVVENAVWSSSISYCGLSEKDRYAYGRYSYKASVPSDVERYDDVTEKFAVVKTAPLEWSATSLLYGNSRAMKNHSGAFRSMLDEKRKRGH